MRERAAAADGLAVSAARLLSLGVLMKTQFSQTKWRFKSCISCALILFDKFIIHNAYWTAVQQIGQNALANITILFLLLKW